MSYNSAFNDKLAKGKELIKSTPEFHRKLAEGFNKAVDIVKKYCEWNYKTAIPVYYPKKNSISLLLPLNLSQEPGNVDVALVVERTDSGSYQGQTILTLPMAYQDARQICRPNSKWLTPSVIKHSDESEVDDDIEDE